MGLTRKQIVMLAVLVFGTFVTVLNQTVVEIGRASCRERVCQYV